MRIQGVIIPTAAEISNFIDRGKFHPTEQLKMWEHAWETFMDLGDLAGDSKDICERALYHSFYRESHICMGAMWATRILGG